MIILIHLLEHIGLPSGVAIGLVIAAKKALTGGISKAQGRRDSDQRHSRGYRCANRPARGR
jgi:hypothetical protein